jgi:cytochrome P450
MTFGYGPHACSGRHLAKASLGVALEVLYGRLADIRVQGLEWRPNPTARFVRSLPAVWAT